MVEAHAHSVSESKEDESQGDSHARWQGVSDGLGSFGAREGGWFGYGVRGYSSVVHRDV